ncbi:Hypothetical predicted protein [Olea europaea subsp. europaea]|uniref:Uncharacterized protein n=1 Tax=Olea europaea subsp. europaea TaxID=158383 RepID=A0A8S0PPP2_OLEEU|nr:Hypothetical predicted protein [Olea europaea subsp. europaea]
MDLEEEHIFYVKITQLEPNSTACKYEIIFVFDAFSTIADGIEQPSEKDKGFLCLAEANNNYDIHEVSPPSTKRSLFQTSSEPLLSNVKVEKKIATSNSENDQVSMKGKLD